MAKQSVKITRLSFDGNVVSRQIEDALRGKQFVGGEGIVKKGIEKTIESVGRLASDGMRQTDREILEIMIQRPDGPAR